jgi:molybdopterin synthase catalytic subunit
VEPYGLTADALDLCALEAFVSDPAAGAVATFLGVSRNRSPDARNVERPVQTLWYEAYEPMARARIASIGSDAQSRFEVTRVACWHRVGEVPVGEASVAIAVSAPHRGAAFDACRHVIDELKRSVPIWKRERFDDGEEWVEGYAGAT